MKSVTDIQKPKMSSSVANNSNSFLFEYSCKTHCTTRKMIKRTFALLSADALTLKAVNDFQAILANIDRSKHLLLQTNLANCLLRPYFFWVFRIALLWKSRTLQKSSLNYEGHCHEATWKLCTNNSSKRRCAVVRLLKQINASST